MANSVFKTPPLFATTVSIFHHAACQKSDKWTVTTVQPGMLKSLWKVNHATTRLPSFRFLRSSAASVGLARYAQVDIPDFWYQSRHFGSRQEPGPSKLVSANRLRQS